MGRDFPPVRTGPGAHPASCKIGTGSFRRVKYGRGVLLTTHSLLAPWSCKSRAIPLPTLWVTTGSVTGTLDTYLLIVTDHSLGPITLRDVYNTQNFNFNFPEKKLDEMFLNS